MKADQGEIEHIYLDDEEDHHPSSHAHAGGHAAETKEEYKKFRRVLLGILVVSSLLTTIRGWDLNRFLADFMAVFFITFAGFKFTDIEAFAHTYRTYDIIAARVRPWGYAFPFVEAFLGFWYLLSSGPNWLNLITLLVTGMAAIGVFKATRRKSKFVCACLGTFIRLPLSKVSLVEDVAMFAMAAAMMFV